MTNRMDLAPVLLFLRDLERNNQRAWFASHRPEYEAAHDRFEEFVSALIFELSEFDDLAGVTAKECIFRIFRDLRFSKDKTPYKTYMSAAIGPGGKRSKSFPYYLSISPDNQSMLACGCHDASPAQLVQWRNAVDTDSSSLKKITGRNDFITAFGGLSGEKLARAPQGYPASHPDIELLRLKNITIRHSVTDEELLSPSVVQASAAVFRTMKPFRDYLRSILTAP